MAWQDAVELAHEESTSVSAAWSKSLQPRPSNPPVAPLSHHLGPCYTLPLSHGHLDTSSQSPTTSHSLFRPCPSHFAVNSPFIVATPSVNPITSCTSFLEA